MRYLLFGLLLSSCASTYQRRANVPAVATEWAKEVDYDLLPRVTGQACTTDIERGTMSPDPAAIGSADIYECAKFIALANAPDADGLLAVNAKIEMVKGQECATVSARPYRLRAVRVTTHRVAP